MLSREEALLFAAVRDEQERQEAIQSAGIVGGLGGAALGVAGGAIPYELGNAVNRLKDNAAAARGMTPVPPKPMTRLKPGPRMAGGLTGMILGGGLGAGMAAIMKRDSDAGALLGKIQAQGGELDENDEAMLSKVLGDIYSGPSQLM